MDLGDPGKWRKSKVESFIRRHLNVLDLGVARYYEMCMWDNKGTLLPSYALLMDNSIVLTENPPKSIVHTVPLARIKDISLIADRHSLIKGKNNNSYVCQHVSIVYEVLKTSGNNKRKPFSSDSNLTSNNGGSSGREYSVLSSDDRSSTMPPLPPRTYSPPPLPSSSMSDEEKDSNYYTSNHSHTDLSNSQYSDISVSPVPSATALEKSFFSQSFLNAYEPTIRTYRTRPSTSNNNRYNNYNARLRSSGRGKAGGGRHHHHYHHGHHNNKEKMSNNILINKNESSSSSARNSSPLSTSSSGFSPERRRPWSDWMSRTSSERKLEGKGRKSRLITEMNCINEGEGRGDGLIPSNGHDTEKEADLHQMIEDTRVKNHWFSRKSKGSSSERSSRPPTATGGGSADEDPNNNSKTNKENVAEKKEKTVKKKSKGSGGKSAQEKVEEMHLYFYQRDSEFVKELSLVWNRQQLKNTEEQEVDTFGGLSKSLWVNRSLRAAEKIVARVAQDWDSMEGEIEKPIVSTTLPFHNDSSVKNASHEDLLRKVAFLHKCLMRYEHLKYLCWKNSVIMSGLIQAMMACLEPLDSSETSGDLRSIELQNVYWDKVATYAILMDIFRTLFEACSVSWFKDTEFIYRKSVDYYDDENSPRNEWEADVWDRKMTIFDVTRKLLSSILRCPFLPRSTHIPGDHGYGCFVTITDPQKFIKASWLTLDDESSAKMAKLICTAHNASVALLFELLAIAHFLPTFIEKTLVTCGVRQLNLERYVRLSVTQIINILWNNHDPINSAQTMILYRQVWNLRNLLRHDRKVLEFIRQNFSEEFHYYATTRGIKSRIPDQYTIKPKVIDACEKLLEDVVGNNGRSS